MLALPIHSETLIGDLDVFYSRFIIGQHIRVMTIGLLHMRLVMPNHTPVLSCVPYFAHFSQFLPQIGEQVIFNRVRAIPRSASFRVLRQQLGGEQSNMKF